MAASAVNDISTLDDFDNETLLRVLEERYKNDNIYTYVGDILIAVNPCSPLPIYGRQARRKYRDLRIRGSQPPHVYWVADNAHRSLIETHLKQCIVVTGDTGAGKTETTKYALQHLIERVDKCAVPDLVEKLSQVNPLIELFGNASTVFNRNSSRFGKLIELSYLPDGTLVGGKLQTFVLEKSRVVCHGLGEKNFHVLHAIFAGMEESKLQYYFIESAATYRILQESGSEPHNCSGTFQDAEEEKEFADKFQEGMSILSKIGFSDKEVYQLIQMMAAVLHIGNIEFQEDEETGGLAIVDEVYVSNVLELLNLGEANSDSLISALISRPRVVMGETIVSFKTMQQAEDARDALAKELYNSLFNGIIDRINLVLRPGQESSRDGHSLTIGILDISGFENLRLNSFEQLLINMTNERLHQYFQQQIFDAERSDYVREQVSSSDVAFNDNSDVLKLLFESPGVLSILEEEVAVPKSNDKSLVTKMDKFLNSSRCYRKKGPTFMFGIVHYAGEVEYNAVGFLEKNKGTLPENLRNCFQSSENMFVSNYFMENLRFQNETGRDSPRGSLRSRLEGKKIRRKLSSIGEEPMETKTIKNKLYDSVASQYKKSLKCLIDRISTAKPNFIKCIKPNIELTSGQFDCRLVSDQLISSGLLDVAKIRRDGYPIRMKVDVFRKRYRLIPEELNIEDDDDRRIAEVIVQHCRVTNYKIGKSKIFLKQDAIDGIEKTMESMEKERKERQKEEQRRKRLGLPSQQRQDDKLDTISETGSMSSGYSTPSNGQISVENPPSYSALSDIDDKQESSEASSLPPKTSLNPSELEEQLPAYDAFRITERDVDESNEFEERALKIMRLSTYILLFLGILGTGTASLLGILMLTSGIRLDYTHRSELTTELLVCYSMPQGVTCLVSSLKILFGRKEWPKLQYLLLALLLSAAQACGTGFLVYRVLPEYDILSGITLILASVQLPTLLNIHRQIFRRRKRKLKFLKRLFVASFSIIASLLQFGFNPIVYVTDIFVPNDSTSKSDIFLTISIFLVSLGWCEAFAGEDVDMGIMNIPLKKWKQEISQCRDKTNFVTCPLKVGIFFLCAYQLVPDVPFALPLPMTYVYTNTTVPNSNETTVTQTAVYESFFSTYTLMLIQVLSGYMCSYLSGIACKIHMQRFSFCLALFLVPILSVSLTIWRCIGGAESYPVLEGTVACPENLSFEGLNKILGVALALLVSISMLTLHTWFPSTERMAKLERLFCLPMWDGVFTAINVLLRRKDDVMEQEKGRKRSGSRVKEDKKTRPMVNICATMWHETRQEMLQLLKSLFRLDRYYSQNVNAEKGFGVERDYFDMRIHVIFDDAFYTDPKTKQRMPNEYVQQLVECIDQASMSVAKGRILWNNHPKKFTTPYGARLEWTLPGGVPMFFHLKDKSKVRHRKRWSQILYLYYLLGYELMGVGNENDILNKKRSRHRVKTFTSLLNKIPSDKIKQAYNTYILTLDGDVDFRPSAVKLLIDRMQKNDKVAAVCGRIHPIGSGPMVWYQQFEYAVGHWLQKAAEHVFGCVLCCPGCFSLFRFAALIDDNVVKMYTTPPSEARHYIQFEQGEDRWLCTLLLQQGWKIDYCAGADSWTFAPESFKEFFIQRRRWAPSTMANILDLLSSWQSTVKMNDNISTLFILYQFVLMSSSILGPGTVTLMIAGSYSSVFSINMYYALLLSLTPVVLFIALCLKGKNDTQIMVAGLLSSVYSVVMVIVTVGMVLNMATESLLSPNVIFLVGLVVIFVVAAISHPKEIMCLVHGMLYYLTVPSTFIFLTIYFLCNLNIVSWGTREGPKRVDPEEEERKRQEEEEKQKKKKKGGKILNALGLASFFHEAASLIKQALGGIKEEESASPKTDPKANIEAAVVKQLKERTTTLPIPQPKPVEPEPVTTEVRQGAWGEAEFLGSEKVQDIMKSEEEFWRYIIQKYLEPINEDKDKQAQIKDDLTSLRNNVVFGYFLMNLLFMIAIFQLQLNEDQLSQFFILGEYEPLSLAFLSVFAIVLLTQFIGMVLHRWGTFLHLMSSTRIGLCTRNFEEEYAEVAFKEAGRLQTGDPEPDYIEDLDSDTEGGSSSNNTLVRYSGVEEDPPDYPNDDQSVILPATTVPRGWTGNIPEPDYGDMEPDYQSIETHVQGQSAHGRRYQNAYERNFSKRFETMRNKYQKRYQRRMSQVNGLNTGNISQREALYNRSIEMRMRRRQSIFS
ncbi:chitin synthase chs-2-like [Argopecten irradians]|uniref:chitin synthase chs-2-like n=1 Tax=Argopecten irradians TaxID=31199 RepID=UPI003712D40C